MKAELTIHWNNDGTRIGSIELSNGKMRKKSLLIYDRGEALQLRETCDLISSKGGRASHGPYTIERTWDSDFIEIKSGVRFSSFNVCQILTIFNL